MTLFERSFSNSRLRMNNFLFVLIPYETLCAKNNYNRCRSHYVTPCFVALKIIWRSRFDIYTSLPFFSLNVLTAINTLGSNPSIFCRFLNKFS